MLCLLLVDLFFLGLGVLFPFSTPMLVSGFNVETVEYKNISFTVWDVGGQDKVSHTRSLNVPQLDATLVTYSHSPVYR